jgi:hypothetical protein
MDAGRDIHDVLAHSFGNLMVQLDALEAFSHLPPVQADPGLDRPEGPRPAHRRPVDLAHHRRPHPTPPRPATGRGPAPPLGTASTALPAHPRPRPPGVPPPPREDSLSRGCAETLQTRPRTSTRLEKSKVSPTLRAREDRETSRNPHRTCPPETAARIKIKLSSACQRGPGSLVLGRPFSRCPAQRRRKDGTSCAFTLMSYQCSRAPTGLVNSTLVPGSTRREWAGPAA